MANTFVKIATVTVGAGGASTMEFTSIPSTYTDLVLKISARGTASGGGTGGVWDSMSITLNSSSANLSYRAVFGVDSSSVSSNNASTGVVGWIDYSGATANTFASTEIYIPNYASSNNKSFSVDAVTENNGTSNITSMVANLWAQTAAVTSVAFSPVTGNFAQYSTATLYGISKS